MVALLDIPRELFLMVCAFLDTRDLAKLSAASRNTYVATQPVLYQDVTIPTYEALVKLTRTLVKTPVVSQLTQRQRERWQLVPESAFSEHVLAHLDVNLVSPAAPTPCNIYHVAQLLATVARKCPRVEITLKLAASDISRTPKLFTGIVFPRVVRVILSDCPEYPIVAQSDYWSFFLGGHNFPDLCQLHTTGFQKQPADRPSAIAEQMNWAYDAAGHGLGISNTMQRADIKLERLESLQSLKIGGDIMLDQSSLISLFGSTKIPTRLTTLEIVNCPQLFLAPLPPVADIFTHASALSTLLQRALTSLPALRKLKLHIVEDPEHYYQTPPDSPHHMCNIVRVLGQNIQHLDLLLPQACNRIFAPQTNTHNTRPQLGLPPIPRKPLETLPQRLNDAGFKYRRLICWSGICSDQHEWHTMTSYAGTQGAAHSWEIVSDFANEASWHVGEHEAVHFEALDVTEQPY